MNLLPQNWMRFWVGLAVSAGFFAANITVNAQAPEIIGEPDLNVLRTNEAFDPVSNTWATKTPMRTKRWNIDTAVAQGKIYAIGGSCCTVSCDPLDTVEIYDPGNDSWAAGVPLPFPPRGNGAAAEANGIIYVVGGQITCGGDMDTNEAFDPATKTWSTKASMPTARAQFGIAAVFDSGVGHEVFYAIGGSREGVGALDTVERYDPGADAWTTKAHMPTPRYGLQVAAVNGKIYAIGGVGGTGDDCTTGDCHTVEEYDPATDTWTPNKAPMPTTRGGSGAASGVVNGIIYVAGGSNNNGQVSIVEAYNPVTDTWSTVPPMPTGRDSLGGAVINNTFYAIGGILSGAATVGRPFVYQVTARYHPTSYDAGINLLSGPCSGLNLPPGNASDLPPGLSIDHTTGVIFGVPTTPVYDAVVPISATNTFGTGCSYVTLSVQSAPPFSPAVSGPMIVSNTSVTGRTNRPFSFQILTKDASDAARFTAGGLPPGLTSNSQTGLISGTPTSDGNFLVSVSVSDGPAIATGILQLTFLSDPTIPIVTSSSSAVLVPGQFFTRTLTADVSPAPMFLYIGTDGQRHSEATCEGLPPGLCFDGVATISGIYSPATPTPTPTPGTDSAARQVLPRVPDTRKIRPLVPIEPIATDTNGTGIAPLNFIEPAATPTPRRRPTPWPRPTRPLP